MMKKIIITGTSKGIGKSVALKLLNHNFVVIGISRTHSVKHENYFSQYSDLNNVKDIKDIINNIIIKFKKIDGFISNAGYGIFDNLENIKEEEIIKFFKVTSYLF